MFCLRALRIVALAFFSTTLVRAQAGNSRIAELRSWRVTAGEYGPVIEVVSTRPITPKIQVVENPLRLVIDLPGSTIGTARTRNPFRNEQIKSARLNQFQSTPPVSRIVLEMLPRLKAGACVHFHDITFPYDYSRHVLDSALFFQHESVLLHAFLAFNSRFRLLAALSMLHYAAPQKLAECLPNYRPAANDGGLNAGNGHFPSSAYLQVVA